MSSIEGKVALVTGAASGIGRATAIALGQKGAKVIVSDISEEKGKETQKLILKAGGTADFYTLNVGDKAQIDQVVAQIVEAHGSLDLAVNNAGIGGTIGPMHLVQEKDWHTMMQINLSGLFFCMQAEITRMLAQGAGRIVNVASLAGLGGVPMGSPYAAAKHGVVGLTKSAAMEYGKLNIRVNSVCPGFIETPILDGVPDKLLDFNVNYIVPMKRIGQPEEVAKTITWLLSEESSYINGHSMLIDGGAKAGL